MNVLIMADYHTPKSGNFVASLLELANFLKKENSTVIFVFPSKDGNNGGYSWTEWLQNQGYQVLLLDDNDENLFEVLNNIIRKNHIDIIHSHFGYKHKFLIKNYQKFGNVKLIFHDHMDFLPSMSFFKQIIKIQMYSIMYRAKGIGIISVMKKKYKAYWLNNHYNWYVPNGLSLMRNTVAYKTREDVRQELGIKSEEKLCLFMGWNYYGKGLDIAARAVAQCRSKNSKIVLGVIGLGKEPPLSVIEFLEKVSIDARDSWIRYFESTEDIFSLHRAADVYISASRSDAFSYGLLESISQNVPVVISDIEGTSWARRYNKCIQFHLEDFEECSKAILKLIPCRFSESNYKSIVEEYSIDKWCTRIFEIYKEMLEQQHGD